MDTPCIVFAIIQRERFERPIVGYVRNGGHVFAVGIVVDIMRAGAGH